MINFTNNFANNVNSREEVQQEQNVIDLNLGLLETKPKLKK